MSRELFASILADYLTAAFLDFGDIRCIIFKFFLFRKEDYSISNLLNVIQNMFNTEGTVPIKTMLTLSPLGFHFPYIQDLKWQIPVLFKYELRYILTVYFIQVKL